MKNSYILLRNNVESAPLFAEDLQRIGLKANDLLWVECQSVCWQNPHEIPELRPLLSLEDNTLKKENKTVANELPIPDVNTIESGHTVNTMVFVEMPVVQKNAADSNSTIIKESAKNVEDYAFSDMQKYGGLAGNTDFTIADKKEVHLKTNYTRSLDDIKEMFVKNMEQNGKDLLQLKLPKQIKKIALYAGLLVTGAILMLLLKSFSSEKAPFAEVVLQQQKESVSASLIETPVYEMETDSAAPPESYEVVKLPVEETDNVKPQNQPALPVTNNKQPVVPTPVVREKQKNEPKEINNDNTEKNIRLTTEAKISKPVTVNEIASKLILTANEYNVGSFGGIRNLKMTLQNNSEYALDKVTVEIRYLNPEGTIVKTDNIIFQSLSPGDNATIAVDKTKRGVKIEYKIVKIDSKELSHVASNATD